MRKYKSQYRTTQKTTVPVFCYSYACAAPGMRLLLVLKWTLAFFLLIPLARVLFLDYWSAYACWGKRYKTIQRHQAETLVHIFTEHLGINDLMQSQIYVVYCYIIVLYCYSVIYWCYIFVYYYIVLLLYCFHSYVVVYCKIDVYCHICG